MQETELLPLPLELTLRGDEHPEVRELPSDGTSLSLLSASESESSSSEELEKEDESTRTPASLRLRLTTSGCRAYSGAVIRVLGG